MKFANVCKIMAEVRKAVLLISWFIFLNPGSQADSLTAFFTRLFLQIKYSLRDISFIITKLLQNEIGGLFDFACLLKYNFL